MKITHVVAAALVGALASTLASAGTEFEATCSKNNCPFQASVPEPVAEFWDPQTGENRHLCGCPECRTPFVAIEDIRDLRHCPKCNKPSLKYRPIAQYSSVREPDQ